MRLGRTIVEGMTRFRRPIEVDWASLGPGVIAIVGPNGAGKTTLVESTCPGILYREFPSRRTKGVNDSTGIQNWADPKGGRIVQTWALGGKDYEAEVVVAGDKDRTQTANLWENGNPIVSGKVRVYDAKIAELLGPAEAAYASVYGVQGGRGRFAELDRADRRGIFRFYLGLEHVARCHKIARDRLAAIDASEAEGLAVEVRRIADEQIPAARTAHAEAVSSLRSWEGLRDERRSRLEDVAAQAALVDLLDAYDAALEEAEGAIAAWDALARTVPAREPEDVEALEAEIRRAREVEAEVADLRAELERHRRGQDKAREALGRARKAAATIDRVPCKGAGECAACEFLVDARAAVASIPETERIAGDWDRVVAETEADIAAAGDVSAQVRELDGRLARARDDRALADRARTAAAERDAAVARAEDLRGRLPADLPEDVPDREVLDFLRDKVREAEDNVTGWAAEEGRRRETIARLEETHASTLARLQAAQRKAEDYLALSILVRALAPEGVQAFEIAAAGPGVAAIANDLLRACYGPRFTLELPTLRELKKGGFEDDFGPRVFDSSSGRWNSLEGISGGEGVIVDTALGTALALFARRTAGSPFETLWRDETPANLYPPHDLQYVQILRRTREIGGFHQVLFVTDPRTAQAADRIVYLSEDGDVEVA